MSAQVVQVGGVFALLPQHVGHAQVFWQRLAVPRHWPSRVPVGDQPLGDLRVNMPGAELRRGEAGAVGIAAYGRGHVSHPREFRELVAADRKRLLEGG